MIKFIYKWIPIPVIFTDSLIGSSFAGRSYGIFVCIRPSHKNNEALLQHELTHCKQFYRTFGIHSILYNVSKSYRLKAEVEAYKQTIKYKVYTDESQYQWIVNMLCNDYGLDVTEDDVKKMLAL